MLEQGPALLNGVRLLLKASGAGKAYVCIEDNKPEAIENLRKILEKMREQGILDQGEELEIKALPTKYPQGGERQLIQSVLGREVPMGGLPADAGVIVSNVGTAKAAADMVLGNRPLTSQDRYGNRLCEKSGEFPGSYRHFRQRTGGTMRRSHHRKESDHWGRPYDRSLCGFRLEGGRRAVLHYQEHFRYPGPSGQSLRRAALYPLRGLQKCLPCRAYSLPD